MARIDPYKSEERYERWKASGAPISGVGEATADLIRRYVLDMEMGLNVSKSSRKGPRSFVRLNTLRMRIPSLAKRLASRFELDDLRRVTEEQLHTLFSEMRSGVIRKENGKPYAAVSDFIKDFKGFWHWYMERSHREGERVQDVTAYLATQPKKPRWVYLREEEVRRLCAEAKYEYRVLIMFLLDSGVRSPTELVNIRVSDFSDDFRKVHIRDEASKTFGRRINLMLCSDMVRAYVQTNHLETSDSVFSICPTVANRYLKRLALRVLGEKTTLAGESTAQLTLYDFRHISACFWAPRYKSESALKYRFGWRQTERIHYYTELLGMKDNITDDDMLHDSAKTAIERRLAESERERGLLQERLNALQEQMNRIAQVTDRLVRSVAMLSSRQTAHDDPPREVSRCGREALQAV